MKKESPKFIILKMNQSLGQSLFSSAASISGTAFLIYISQGSTWWTFITGILFLLAFWAKINETIKHNRAEFYSKAEAVEWAASLPDD